MAQHTSKPRSMSDVVRNLLTPAMTSHYECVVIPNEDTIKWIKINRQVNYDEELTTLSCSSASLPGSTLFTHEVSNDFTGVTEKMAYRRSFDDRLDLTFYVDSNYNMIKFFEYWMQYIVNEQKPGSDTPYYSYKVNYPEEYRGTLIVDKFDRDYSTEKSIRYTFIDAYPINISSMPISYERSNVLTCTVGFTYSRYIIGNQATVEKSNPNIQTDFNIKPPEISQDVLNFFSTPQR